MTTTNTQNQQKKSVNTNGIQFYNNKSNSIIRSTLVLGFYNQFVNLKIHPALTPELQTASRQYDYNQFVSCLLSFEDLVLLSNRLEVLDEYIKKGVSKTVGIPLGTTNSNLLSVIYNAENNESLIYIWKNVDSETKKPETFMGYQFNKGITVDDYNQIDGTYTSSEFHKELYAFKAFIDTVISAMTNGNAHCQRYADRFWREKLSPSAVGPSNNENGNNQVSWTNSNDKPVGSIADSENLEFTSDIEKFLN